MGIIITTMIVIELIALPFFQRALIVGVILGVLMATLGVFVVLRRISFFADAIGHSALAGIAGALLAGVNPFIGGLAVAALVAFGITGVRRMTAIALDTLLAVFFSAFVSLGVILLALSPGYQADLISFLFGNILTVTQNDVVISLGIALVSAAILVWAGKGFVAVALDPNLAKAEGVPVARLELILLLMLAVTIALAIKLVGVLLVTALLIIPAASAQNISRSLATMFYWSMGISVLVVVVGMVASAVLATPSGPTIVLTSSAVFVVSLFARPASQLARTSAKAS